MITIDNESKQRKNSSLSFDVMTDRYRTVNGPVVPSPEIAVLEQNIYFLLKHSEKKRMDKKYAMKPSYLSYNEYRTIVLGNLLMYVNNVRCLEEFTLDTVVVPKLGAIVEICQYRFPDKDVNKLLKIGW